MEKWWCLSFLALCVLADDPSLPEKRSGFLVTVPKILLRNSYEKVCLTLHHVGVAEGTFSFQILAEQNKVLASEEHQIINGVGRCFKFHVPGAGPTQATFEVKGEFGDYTFKQSRPIHIRHQSTLTFVQTDKPIYKPGQTVKFRILRLTPSLKPILDNVSKIWVEDPAGIRIAQWLSVSPEEGLVDLNMEMSTEPTLGTWTIKVDLGAYVEKQSFDVDHYVLPKFEVKITSPPFILGIHQKATWKVCANYSYGKPVQGMAEIRAAFFLARHWRPNPGHTAFEIAHYKGKINGCHDVTGAILDTITSTRNAMFEVKVTAVITEDGTNETMKAEVSSEVHRAPLNLNFDSVNSKYFKPGIPFAGKLLVTNPDGTPAADEAIEISAYAGVISGHRTKLATETGTTDRNGIIRYTVGAMPDAINHINFNAESIKWGAAVTERYGRSISYPHHPRRPPVDKPVATFYMQAWYSPSASFLQVDRVPVLSCEQEFSFLVKATARETLPHVHYQVVSRGKIALHGSVPATPVDDAPRLTADEDLVFLHRNANESAHVQFHVPLPILDDLSPVSRLLVFYVRNDGEVVSDSIEVKVEKCLKNKVELSFSHAEVMPADTLTMSLRASPHSWCAVGAVDKTVHYLRSDNQLNEAKVFSALNDFHIAEKSEPIQKNRNKCQQNIPRGPPGWNDDWELRRRKRHYIVTSNEANYVDAIEAFDDAGMVVISDLTLETRPCRENPTYYNRQYEGAMDYDDEPEFMMTGAGMPGMSVAARSGQSAPMAPVQYSAKVPAKKAVTKPKVEIRNYFPETWLWELHKIGDSGSVSVPQTIPHTITDWIGSAFCTSRVDGLGLSPAVTVRAFQPFFLTYTLPYSVKRGETLPVVVSISNYVQECLPMKISLEDSADFKLLSASSFVKMCLCGDEIATHRFVIRPKTLGKVNITVYAYTTLPDVCSEAANEVGVSKSQARDAISKQLLVEAEGFPKEQTWSTLVCPGSPTEVISQEIDAILPDLPIVADSIRGYLSVMGDLMAPSLQGLERLVRLPVGCGEQNMVLFAPNIYVMQYLTASLQLTPVLEHKLISHMKTGYQRELTYKHDDGSYSAFGKSDKEGSMWLTAFVIKSFAQAKTFILIDQKHFDASFQWIVSRQLENGCFPFWGRVLSKDMKGGLGEAGGSFTALSAYVLIALLEAGIPPSNKVVEDAFYCLKGEPDPDTYTLVLSAYAAILAKKEDVFQTFLGQLDGRATEKDGLLYWEKPGKNSLALSVEMSAYVILSLTSAGGNENLLRASRIVRWIAKQRNANGGFVSTQDTVVALQALAKFAAVSQGNGTQLALKFDADEFQHSFHISNDNKLLMQTVRLPVVPTIISFEVTGKGCALIQAVVRYNVEKTEGSDAFDLAVSTQPSGTTSASCKRHKVEICTKYKLSDGESNMAVVEADMISGFEPDKKSLEQMAKDSAVKLKRWDTEGDTLNMYFDELTGQQKCFSFFINQVVEVGDVQPAVVSVYDYYEPELSVDVSYSIEGACDLNDKLPELTDEELLDLESEIIVDGTDPVVGDGNKGRTISVEPEGGQETPVTDETGRVPVDEVIPDPVRADVLGDQPKDPIGNFKSRDWEPDFPEGVEGPRASIALPQGSYNDSTCPYCPPSFPADFTRFYCRSKYAFTATVLSKSSMKMVHNMGRQFPKPVRESTPIMFVISQQCRCNLQIGKRLLIVGSPEAEGTLQMQPGQELIVPSRNTYFIPAPQMAVLMSKVKQAKQAC